MTNKFDKLYNKIINETANSINIPWSSPEIAECMEKITKKMEAIGFDVEVVDMFQAAKKELRFRMLGDKKTWEVGTYINPFGNKETTVYIKEVKTIIFKEVYKHNGAKANASIDCYVLYNGIDKFPEWFKLKMSNNSDAWVISNRDTTYKQIDIKRFKPTISDKLMDRMIGAAIEAYNSIELKDWSGVELGSHPEE